MDPISAAFTGVNALLNILRATAELTIDTTIVTKINDAQRQVSSILTDLIQAQQLLLQTQKDIEEKHRIIQSYDDWEKTRTQYQMVSTMGGATIWESVGGSPKHYACPVCFTKKTVVPLQTTDGGYYDCPSCKGSLYKLREPAPRPPIKVETDFDPRDF